VKGDNVVTKRGTKTTKRGKAAKNLPVKSLTARKAKGVKGGAKGLFEVQDYSFDIEQGLNIGSSSSTAPTSRPKPK
jgi:hypothetical protein